ncbi:MAG TPA: exonuclease SbcCD subunit D C-terminal domain-containing protein [Gemmatimonadaceae bacterium]|nr:exonuclease SbcCD subunit D C-terminal domain-containing protein [Gemmatimonadaceae bacterium]
MSLRVLHTADWHLGHQLHGFDRAHEQARILAWLLDTIEAERVNALLVAGDVFDSANPPTEALAHWYRFLGDAWRRFDHLQVVVIGGNHDSPARLDATDPFLRALDRLHVLGGAQRRDGVLDLDRHVVPLGDGAGRRAAWVAAVPHLRASETGTGDEQTVAAGVRRVYDGVLDRIRARREPGQAIIAMGHLYLVGGQVSSLSERRLSMGNELAVGHDLFPAEVTYAALGHLHLAQPVGGKEHIRYAGSLMPLSLSEREYPHQALLAVLDGEQLVEVRELRAPRLVELPRIPTRGTATVEEALAAIRELPARADGDPGELPLLEVEVRVEKPEPGLRQRVDEALQGKAARLARLGVTLTGTGAALGDVEVRSIADVRPEEVFRRRWARDHQGAPTPELVAAFDELLDLVQQETP